MSSSFFHAGRERAYRVVVVPSQGRRKGRRIVMARGPLTHREAVTVLSKMSRRPGRREMIEEIRSGYRLLQTKRRRAHHGRSR
jgi:hypothetical protein